MLDRYEPAQFEAKWQKRWADAELFRTREAPGRPKFYGLDFFPYPSGAGLSVGHCRNYIPTDVVCRMKAMQGFNVLHPMGFDAFGLPAENEAIKRATHPAPMIERYAANYRRQMDLIGVSYDWSRSFSSSDPGYYRWTQWIFQLLYRRGLAYRKMASVNWCPQDKTALANEEVVGGLCERCGTPVEKREIPQWFFKITDYAQRLLDDLDEIDWPEGIKNQQRNWIGRSEGVEFSMKVVFDGESPEERQPSFDVFTTRIDTIFGVTFCVLAPEHPILDVILARVDPAHRDAVLAYREATGGLSEMDRQAVAREKTGVATGAHAINPATGKRVPIYVADYVMMGYGTGAIMAVPGHDQRDFDFATAFGLPIPVVIVPEGGSVADVEAMHARGEAFETKDGFLANSGEYDGMSVAESQTALGTWMEALGIGRRRVNYKLRDWLISRQRYWGCPIPVIHSADGELQLVPEDCLPVELPDVERYEPGDDGASPLAGIADFVNTTDRDGRLGRRETDTMGGFACSSWYFLRFCDPYNDQRAWDPAKADYWMPVDCYVGGAEHAVMHLLYARFWMKVLYEEGLVPVKEPFARLMNQGQLLANTPYRKPRPDERLGVGEDGILISFEEAASLPPEDVFWRWARMSKSKGNVVTPDEVVASHGADALRVYELFVAPFDADVQWSIEGLQGSTRFLGRVFKLVSDVQPRFVADWPERLAEATGEAARQIRRATHQTLKKVGEDCERFHFNTAIAAMMTLLNTLGDLARRSTDDGGESVAWSEAVHHLVLMLAPIAPHSADELWESLGYKGFTFNANWPTFDPEIAQADTVTVAVQVNGKLRDTLELAADADDEALREAAMASPKVRVHVDGKTVRKVIVVPSKLVNIVVA